MDQQVTSIISHYSIYDIDNSSSTSSLVSIPTKNESELLNFLRRMAADTRSSNSSRMCLFKDESKLKPLITKLLENNNINEQCKKIADLLAASEFKMNIKIAKLGTEVKKGSLIITRLEIAKQNLLLITKIDIEEFFQTKTMELDKGLPADKGLQKSCLIEIETGNIVEPFSLADSNGKISSFWVNDFVCANYVRDNKQNTEKALQLIGAVLASVNKESPQDHTELRQNLYSYFKTAESYDHTKMIKAVIGDYQPISKELDTSKIQTKLLKLTAASKFDGIFQIDKDVVKTKGKKSYKFEHDIELKANSGDTSSIFHKIIEGQPYVLIKTNAGYQQFKPLTVTEENEK